MAEEYWYTRGDAICGQVDIRILWRKIDSVWIRVSVEGFLHGQWEVL